IVDQVGFQRQVGTITVGGPCIPNSGSICACLQLMLWQCADHHRRFSLASKICLAASLAKPSTIPEFVSTAPGHILSAARFSSAKSASVILTFTWVVLFINHEWRLQPLQCKVTNGTLDITRRCIGHSGSIITPRMNHGTGWAAARFGEIFPGCAPPVGSVPAL